MDPFQIALLMMQAGQNPEQMAALLDQSGLPPPTSAGAPAAGVPSNVPGISIDDGSLGALLRGTGGAGAAATAPGAAMVGGAGATPAPAPAAAPAPMQAPPQFKAPEPIKPIMTGGVTGGVNAAKSNTSFSGVSPAMALMQALIGGGQAQNPLRVPQLGSLLRGGKY
jgi:hypothetical protein